MIELQVLAKGRGVKVRCIYYTTRRNTHLSLNT
ncbi:hypothetical protein E9230_002901 [Corynebacterium glutamicum]|nr:hypothetical protein [Corynebacterium glutamicum]